MNSIKLRMTATTPSCFGMPISGHASVITPATDARTATMLAVRPRGAVFAGVTGAVKGGLGFAQSYVPGTTAWSPPTC